MMFAIMQGAMLLVKAGSQRARGLRAGRSASALIYHDCESVSPLRIDLPECHPVARRDAAITGATITSRRCSHSRT